MPQDTPTQIDSQALDMVKALGMQESGGNYNAPAEKAGKSLGGAYQYQAPTWKAYAGDILGDANAPFTPENQDKVTYGMVKKWKDSGMQPGEIAHMWNPGSPDYPNQVVDKLKKIANKSSQPTNNSTQSTGYTPPTPPSNSDVTTSTPDSTPKDNSQEPGLGQQLIGRTNDAINATQNTISGKINPISGILQTVGAGAGAVGDVVNKGLELIPGVKQVENLLGQGVGALAKTPTGQSVVKSIQGFTQAHPELSADIGAGFNILTAIPILRGLGGVKNVAADAVSQGLRGVVLKSFANDLAESATTKTAQKLLNQDVIDTIIKEGSVPDMVTQAGRTKLSTEVAVKSLGEKISKIDDEVLQPALKGSNLQFPIEGVKNLAKPIAIDNLSDPAAVEKILDRISAKYGEKITLEDLNQAKRDISRKMSEAAFGDPDLSNMRIARMALQQSVEQGSLQFGLGDVAAINKQMSSLIKAQDFLNAIDGKVVPKKGLVHGLIKGASMAGGEAVGSTVGLPFAGTFAGGGASGAIENQLTKLTPRAIRAGIIKRTAEGAVKQTGKQVAKKVAKGALASLSQKVNQNSTSVSTRSK